MQSKCYTKLEVFLPRTLNATPTPEGRAITNPINKPSVVPRCDIWLVGQTRKSAKGEKHNPARKPE